MSKITYIAHARAPLITTTSPPHSAGTEYSFDIKLNEYLTNIEAPKSQIITQGSLVETILHRTGRLINVRLGPFLHAELPQLEEFIYSAAGGEQFDFDPWGSIAAEDNPIPVIIVNKSFNEQRITHGQAPQRFLSLTLRQV